MSIILINKNTSSDMPVPTEFVNKKKDRKKFKQGRKDWMKNMHRSAPDVDWEEMDRK